jgi:hypothetical protein
VGSALSFQEWGEQEMMLGWDLAEVIVEEPMLVEDSDAF